MTIVDCKTNCILTWAIEPHREVDTLQHMVNDDPQGMLYYSDLFATYRDPIYKSGIYTPMPDKNQVFRVEGMNAEFRHHLSHLARESRCTKALRIAVKVFGYAWNQRQLYKHQFPCYPAHVIDFGCMSNRFPTHQLIRFDNECEQ